MTDGIYNRLLIIGTICSFIQGMTMQCVATTQIVNTNILGDFTEVQLEKFCIRRNPRKRIISVQTGNLHQGTPNFVSTERDSQIRIKTKPRA